MFTALDIELDKINYLESFSNILCFNNPFSYFPLIIKLTALQPCIIAPWSYYNNYIHLNILVKSE